MARQHHALDTSSSGPTRALTTSTTAASSSPDRSGIKKRAVLATRSGQLEKGEKMDDDVENRPGAVDGGSDYAGSVSLSTKTGASNRWIIFALASGFCAAFNGVFAKLTTNDLTSNLSQGIASFLGLSAFEGVIELIVRCSFFGLNLAFNGVMWTLFTQALALGNSTTQVSIMNTSSNFVITAVLGFAVFSESLPPLWWLGAAMLVAGNVIIGQKDESAKTEGISVLDDDDASLPDASAAEGGPGSYRDRPVGDASVRTALEKADEEDLDLLELGDLEAE